MEKDPKYLLEEQELVVAQAPHWTEKLLKAFPAFRHHNYRLFFVGQLTSLIGTWMQIVALGWFVLTITNSAFWVAFVPALDLLPILLFSLPAGILADRTEKRLIVFTMQVVMMVTAFLLAILSQLAIANLFIISLLALIAGTAHAFEMPARQSFMFEVVGKRDLPSAIALNVGMFNSARVIGPAIAGLLIAVFSIPLAFFLNGVSYLAVLFVLLKMRVKRTSLSPIHAHPFEQLKEGVRFSITHVKIRTLLLVLGFVSLVPWAYNAILPVMAREIFHVGSEGYGILLSAAGLGALFGAIFVSSRADRIDVANTIGVANLVLAAALFVFSFVTQYQLALVLLFIVGFTLVLQISLSNATIQRATPDFIRGRVMSVYSLMFLGLMPFGNIAMGSLASALGVQGAVRIFAIMSLLGAGFYLIFLKNRLSIVE